MLVAENLGLDFSSIPMKVSGGQMIEILNDNEEDAIDKYEQVEVLVKMELDREEDRAEAGAQDGSRRSNRGRIANQQFEDYELYVTVEEEELKMATMDNNPAEDKQDENVLAAVAHYIMVHYEEKEGIKKKKKKYKPKSGRYQLEAGIKQFGECGETAVTKELNQFNKYRVFEPKHARDLSD
jgi:hypothetical protein